MLSRAEFLRLAGLSGAAAALGVELTKPGNQAHAATDSARSNKASARPSSRGKKGAPTGPPAKTPRKPISGQTIPPLDENLARWIANLVEASHLPGLSIAAIEDNRIAHAQGFGFADRAKGEKVTQDTVFQAASLTKPTFAYLVLKLCESGQLSLDLPLRDYLPKIVSEDERSHRITAREVLAHMSGLPLTHFPNWPEKLEFAPGDHFAYSGAAYLYLQDVVEAVLSRPLNEVMEERIVRPLGLHDTAYVWKPRFEEDVAKSYDAEGKVTLEKNRSRPRKANAAGSLHTTARDYANFVIEAILKEDAGKLAIDAVYRRMMVSPQVRLAKRLGWGLGWGIQVSEPGDRFWHWGDSRGFMAYTIGSIAERRGLVILTNGTHGLRICEQVARRVIGDEQAEVFAWIYSGFYGKYDVELPELPEAARKLCLPSKALY